MKYFNFTFFLLFTVACSTKSIKNEEMGLLDKLFGNKEKKEVPNEPVINSEALMDSDKFWNIIETSKSNSLGDFNKQQLELEKELQTLTALEVLEFDNRFRALRGQAYTWELWAAAYIMNGGCSDDCFSDFRGWLIGQGRIIFENALKDPESLVILEHNMETDDWEGLSYVPMTVYEKKTGKDIPQGIKENFEITGEEWEEEGDDLKINYPKLWRKWGFE